MAAVQSVHQRMSIIIQMGELPKFAFLLLLLLLLGLLPCSHQLPITPQQIQINSSDATDSDAVAAAVSPLSQSSLSLRPDWLQQKVRPDSEWQRKMELLLGRTSLIKSAEQEAIMDASRRTMAARKGGPGGDSFRAAIKQILLGIH